MENNILDKNYYALQGGTILWIARRRADDMGNHYNPHPRVAYYYNDRQRAPEAIVHDGQDNYGNAIYQF